MSKAVKSLFPENVSAHSSAISAVDATPVDGASGHWVMLLPKGTFSGRDGRGPWSAGDEANLQAIVNATLKRAGSTELVIDYDHQTMFGAVPGVGGRAPAAGWIKEFEIRDDGLWGRVEWTETAAQAIRAGEYRYLSPVYQFHKSGKIVHLLSAGLTNVPNLDLAAVAASADLNQQEETMEKIALALGLSQGASEADILAAINSVLTSTAAMAVVVGLDKNATPDAILTAVQSVKAGAPDPAKYVPIEQVTAMQASIKTLQDTVAEDKAETAVNNAIAEGKLMPALKEWGVDLYKSNPAAFEGFVGKAPVLTAAQRATATPPAKAEAALDDVDTAVMRQLGLSSEEMLKSKSQLEASH
ncbi:phage protease [Mycoplana ramosa]|uniref:Phage protease n=1 Tax=Mycoplana ramosa TaxID=40837 RepID=A0ABW3Z310_MYCRA